MSPRVEWTRIAVSGYMREDGMARVVVPLEIDAAHVFDQRDENACLVACIDRELSNEPWRKALEKGVEPPSWTNSDAARALGADGIVDRSRMIAGGWHVNLFRWNHLGGPTVRVVGEPVSISVTATGPKWG